MSAESIFPIAYGNEEEVSLLVRANGSPQRVGGTEETVTYHLPSDIQSSGSFLTNGGRLYWDNDHLESATPECSNIDELVLRIHASEALLTRSLSARDGRPALLQLNRRVVDAQYNSWGMHDNFGFVDAAGKFTDPENMPVVLGHLATRSFITGAGLVKPYGYRYAQKADIVHDGITGYAYAPYMLRLAANSQDTVDRVEIRCGDINLSDWATRVRVGSTALALAIQQTPMAKHAPAIGGNPLRRLNDLDILHLRDDGTIRRTANIVQALNYQRWQAETGLSLVDKGYAVPLELQKIAEEVVSYCDDFDAVLWQGKTIPDLAGRADWADKFTAILRSRQKNERAGIKRTKYDTKAQAQDILYDQIEIKTLGNRVIKYGWGYRLQRDTHGHKPELTVLQKAIITPPDTRARVRAGLVREGYKVIEWDCVNIDDEPYYLPDPLTDKVA